jgi:hypothetical protein
MQRMLKLGCEPGPDVMDLQDALNLLLGTSRAGARTRPLVVDGVFGPQTRLRLMEYQRSRGMLDDGIVTVAAWQRIRRSLERIPGLVVVRPLGGGGAGACVNVDKNAEEAKKGEASVAEKSSGVAVGGGAAAGGRAGTSGRGFIFSAERVIRWKSGLTGIDRKSWAGAFTLAEEEGKSQGEDKEEAKEKEQDKKKP